jgi:hypothetical protein
VLSKPELCRFMHRYSQALWCNCFGVFTYLFMVVNRYLILGKIAYNILIMKFFTFVENS